MGESKIRNGRNLTNIEYINVYGLFDRYDVNIPFDKIANIYIGENGMGKTTILNCIYFLLDKKFSQLSEINFDSIEIKFKTELQPHRISIYDINKYNQRRIPRERRYVEDDLIEHMFEEMLNEYDENMFYNHKLYIEDTAGVVARRISRMFDIPFSVARRSVYEYMDTKRFSLDKNKKGEIEKVKRLISSINKNIDQKILYLPTYRRIEDDFSKLNISAEKVRESDLLIRFGMSDVLILKNKILENIRQEAIDGFNKMAGVLLKQYANSTDKTDVWRRSMLKVKFYDSVDDSLLKFAVIVSQSNGKWVFCKHKGRDTYEVPGGHREPEESILETARRELQEETGAVKFEIKPICVYSVTGKTRVNATGEETFGLLCFAEISEFAKELHSEMEKVVLMDELPENWTYPLIQPKLIEKYLEIKKLCGQNRGY